jgi:hypothetical protein
MPPSPAGVIGHVDGRGGSSSSLAWYFSQIALTDWASIRACAGS